MILGVAAGCLFALLVVGCVIDYSRPLMYRGSGLGALAIVLTAVMAAEVVALFHFPGFVGDIKVYCAWAIKLARGGPAAFYQPGYGYGGEYAPASVYPLWLSGATAVWLHLAPQHLRLPIEIPQIVMSFALAETLFVFLRRTGFSPAQCWIGAMLVALNPVLVFDTVVWGQTDAFVTLLMWLMVLMTIDGQYELAAALATAAIMTKTPSYCAFADADPVDLLVREAGAIVYRSSGVRHDCCDSCIAISSSTPDRLAAAILHFVA